LVYFTAIWYILWSLGIFCGNLVHFSPFWYAVPRKIWQPWQRPIFLSKDLPKKAGRVSAKRARDEAEVEGSSGKSDRFYNGEPIPEQQPILLSGAIMRDYQVT
jgi:hypothetical protein